MSEFLGQSRKRFFDDEFEYRSDGPRMRWYSPLVWFIRPVWSWLGWILAVIIIIMIVGAISSATTTSFAVEKKMIQAVLTEEEEKKRMEN
jgi:hypothetical protein